MPLTLAPSGYCRGIPKAGAPVIPGFRVIAHPQAWLQAEQHGKRYIVRETDTHWIMERFDYGDQWPRNRKGRRQNNRTRFLDTSEAVAVRKGEA